nr:DUF6095 family protein [uncultured Winogradskyella sp.]
METDRTDKEILRKGLRQMGICLLLMFTGPILLYVSFSNKEKTLYIPLIIVSIILCFLAIFFLFKGINTILDSMFNKK